MSLPPPDIEVDEALIRRLLSPDFSDLAAGGIRLVGEGWDNYAFMLDDSLALRLPRRRVSVPLLENEQRWLPHLAPRLPLDVPSPVHCGSATDIFPWPWSIVRWIPGTTSERHTFPTRDALLLADTLRALHQAAPSDAPDNPYRGVPLARRSGRMRELLAIHSRTEGINLAFVEALWVRACGAGEATERRWLHGDLHPRNVLVRDGALVGIIDWGDLCAGDVATDLACGWLLIDDISSRTTFFSHYGATAALRARAMGWALLLGLSLGASTEPGHAAAGRAAIRRVLDDPHQS